jgi:superfamily II DNA or RNA helicase
MAPAETFEKVCAGLARLAPYRFFLSATQTRTDGAELVLKGITGPVVYEKSFQELVDEGFLSRPHWKMIRVPSHGFYHSDDAMKMTQQHLYYAPEVLRAAATVINGTVRMGHRVLVLVDEMEQYTRLLSMLDVDSRFAHGGVTKDNRKKLPEQYWKSDPSQLVRDFDRGEFPVLVGTSCISMGTDIRSPETVVYLQGGKSDIQVPQAVGRGTRRGFEFPNGRVKRDFNFIDFCPMVVNSHYSDTSADPESPRSIPFKHALARAKMYEKLYPGAMQWTRTN